VLPYQRVLQVLAALLKVLHSAISAFNSLISGSLHVDKNLFHAVPQHQSPASPYMVVSHSQVETGSRTQSEEPIQSNVTCVASKLICANGKTVLWFTTFPEYILDIRIGPQWDCSPLMQGRKVSCHSTAVLREGCADTPENLAVHDKY